MSPLSRLIGGFRNTVVVSPSLYDHDNMEDCSYKKTVRIGIYVCMITTYRRVWINRIRLPILLVVT